MVSKQACAVWKRQRKLLQSLIFHPVTEQKGTRLDDSADVAEAMVEMKVYQRQVQASAKVVQTADEVIGFLIDVV